MSHIPTYVVRSGSSIFEALARAKGGAETTVTEAMRPRRLGPQRRRYAISCQPFGRKHLLIYRLWP